MISAGRTWGHSRENKRVWQGSVALQQLDAIEDSLLWMAVGITIAPHTFAHDGIGTAGESTSHGMTSSKRHVFWRPYGGVTRSLTCCAILLSLATHVLKTVKKKLP